MKPECAVIGILIREPPTLDAVLEAGINREHFLDSNLGEIWDRMLELDAQNARWDLPTLGASLPHLAVRLVDLLTEAPITQNAAYFAKEVVAQARRRRGIELLTEVSRRLIAHDPFDPMTDLDAFMHQTYMDLFVNDSSLLATPTSAQTALKSVDEYEEAKKLRDAGKRPGLDTGFTLLNATCGGFRPRAMYVLGARTGMGKTTLALNMARSASRDGAHVAFFTIEMADTQIVSKVLADAANVPHARIIDADLSEEQEERFFYKLEEFGKGSLAINDRAGRTLETFEAECRRLQRAKRLDMAVLDYIQLMRDPSRRYSTRAEEVSAISGRIKALALALNVPILVLAQINREATKEKRKMPSIAQLKDSGAIEQDADGIFLLHREAYYEEGDRNLLILAKNRFGAPGTLEVGCDLTRNRFMDLDA